jgi:phage terminase large subunit-like protein
VTATAATRKRAGRKPAAWKRYAHGSELEHFARFCREHLVQSVDDWDGLPLELERFQRDSMGEALAYGDDGWPVWQSVVFVWPRKNSKTTTLAAYGVYRLLTSDGSPEILFAAASDKQADKLFQAAATFIRRSPVLSRLARVRDHAGQIVREDGQGIIHRMSSDPKRLHGYNPSLVVCDELAQWTTDSLKRAYAALTSGGGARRAPQVFTITTAGEASTRSSSILGRLLDAALESDDFDERPGLRVSRLWESKTLVWGYEAPTDDPFDAKAMKLANPASWITTEYLARQAANPELTDAEVLQLHGCVWAAAETTFVPAEQLAAAAGRGAEVELEDGDQVVLGFDGSERRDETWLTACSLDGVLQPLARWAKPPGAGDAWRIPRRDVDEAVAAAHERFDVLEFAGDPPGWYAEFDRWSEQFGEDMVVEFETRQAKRFAPACERVRAAFADGTVAVTGKLGQELVRHFSQCVAYDTPYGVAVRKDHPDSPRKIDGAVSAVIAYDRAMWHQAEGSQGIYAGLVEMPA